METIILRCRLGKMALTADDQHLSQVAFVDDSQQENSGSHNLLLQAAAQQLDEYFHGQRTSFSLPLAFRGTDLQKAVWQAIAQVAYGQVVTYQQLAASIKRERAVRACANAVGANRFAIIIPCHRIVHSSGKKIGYGGGVARKLWLLAHESKQDE